MYIYTQVMQRRCNEPSQELKTGEDKSNRYTYIYIYTYTYIYKCSYVYLYTGYAEEGQ